METKTYNVYIPFYKKDSSGYDQKYIHTQVEAVSEESALRDAKLQFEVNNKGYKIGRYSIIKITPGFQKRDMVSFGCSIMTELGKLNVRDNICYFFDKWYSNYKLTAHDK